MRDRCSHKPGSHWRLARPVPAASRPTVLQDGMEASIMNNIVYIVGAVVIVLFILGFLGFR